jgi:hypothetical protein
LSYNQVGSVLKISQSVVGKNVSLARVAGVDRAVAEGLSDDPLAAPASACAFQPPIGAEPLMHSLKVRGRYSFTDYESTGISTS